MENTGERHILGTDFVDEGDYYIHLLHIASYEYALKYVENKIVLDYGCGSGYGAHILAKKAKSVTGVDISREAVKYAKENFESENLYYKDIDALDLQKFDVILSFQVIEHVTNENEYMNKLKSLLNPGGVLLLTTPDRTDRLFKSIQKPWNIYHLKEYSDKSMRKLIRNFFDEFEILKISSKPELVIPEITRRKKQRLITLPCTLFFYPNFVRVFLLKLQATMYKNLRIFRNRNKDQSLQGIKQKDTSYLKYKSTDIVISKNPEFPTDLYIVCKASLLK